MRSTMLARKDVRKISFLACEFSPSKTHLSDFPESLISRINEVYVFFNKISLYKISHLLYNISGMLSLTLSK